MVKPLPLGPGGPRRNNFIVSHAEALGICLEEKSLALDFWDGGFDALELFEVLYRHGIKNGVHAVTSAGCESLAKVTLFIVETFAYFRSPLSIPLTWARGETYCTSLIVIITALPDRVIHALPTGAASAFFITSDMS
jgi:hypothetical protein